MQQPPYGSVPSQQALFLENCVPTSTALGSLRPCLHSLIPFQVTVDWVEGSHGAQAGPIKVLPLSVHGSESYYFLLRDFGQAHKLPGFQFLHLQNGNDSAHLIMWLLGLSDSESNTLQVFGPCLAGPSKC